MNTRALPNIVKYAGEDSLFQPGERVKISIRFPVGHYRVPRYIRGKSGVVESVITPKAVNNEDEGFGLNAGLKGYYYRVAIPLTDLWSGYAGSPKDNLRIEVFENWLQRTD